MTYHGKYQHHRPKHQHYHHYHKPARPRSPSPPPGMSSSQAIAILSDLWGSDSAAWKPADCGFGSHPLSWPPRMLTALADLARAAGRGARKRDSALRLVEDLVAREQRKDGRLCKATPEHVNQAAEILDREAAEAKERRRASASDDRRDARRHSTAGREEYGDDRRYAREDERERDAGVGFSFRGAAGQRRVSSRDDAYYGDVDRVFNREMRSRESLKPREYHKSERVYASYEQSAKQEQRVAPEVDQSHYTKPSSDPQERFAKEDQGSVPKPLQSNNTSIMAVTEDETAKLHPQRAKRLLEGDDTESDETNKKSKLTDANMTPLPFKASQPSTSQPAPAETSQPHSTITTTQANSSKDIANAATQTVANTNSAATQTNDDNNKNKDLIAKLEAELATLQAQIATQTAQLAEERATQSELAAAMDRVKLDLDLTDAARAATEADAGKWRAFGPGMRAIMRENKRLAKVEMQKEKLEREAAGLRVDMRVAQQKCVEAEAREEACDVDAEKVRVIRGDDELKMVNAVLMRENEALRAKLDELGVPVGRAHEKAEKPVG
ncbi:uncharacterized protein LTHEOB_4095 [Lasiodiplodia theobromae]|uniref:uncharacterized protein n=1 Tax=Lasiodiplodia theobromae TaxID=45133 RepID=UPI0015C3126E|nr:uncharacterized protein LTHEOB_4095 [Lasiodiplodia theobromae]KAF4546787.1 hypothetical protein LTHEOB_4095 [Lasiodiplodia theobromae]